MTEQEEKVNFEELQNKSLEFDYVKLKLYLNYKATFKKGNQKDIANLILDCVPLCSRFDWDEWTKCKLPLRALRDIPLQALRENGGEKFTIILRKPAQKMLIELFRTDFLTDPDTSFPPWFSR